MKISIIIPFYNEEENVESVLEETRRTNPDAKIIAVNDGSNDRTEAMIRKYPDVRLISFGCHLGQSAALYTGLKSAQGEICVMMDGDGQSDPADIPELVSALAQADLVCGYRRNRRDTWSRRSSSRIANFIRRKVLHDSVRDTGCTLKAMRKADVRHLLPFDGLHRFLPVFFKNAGLRISEVPVNHRPRQHGTSKYTTLARARRGLYDLIGVRWLMSRKISWPKNSEFQ
ncbi:MAG TPA: glycosyltransferase family 2 protein [Candidatus Saccharimonadales bacterium]|nr:glycosyltransferase family 2 protein [Candidatus Saccharimonadales bacterium]